MTYAQPVTTESFQEARWLLNTNVNLPAAKFHLTNQSVENESKGFLELFSSFGVGLSINYGNAKFIRDTEKNTILEDRTEFSNLIGFQCGILFSSKISEINDTQINIFSIYSGVNVLDLQVGGGYDLAQESTILQVGL